MNIGRIRWAPDYLSERELVRTNGPGAERQFAIGQPYERGGIRYRITRHKVIATQPWATIIVYGVLALTPEQSEAYVSVDDCCDPDRTTP